MLTAKTPVRISFGGGGTDLSAYYEAYGGAVLSTTINKYLYGFVGPRIDGHVQVISSDERMFTTWAELSALDLRDTALEIPIAVLKELDCQASVDLFLVAEVPAGTGLGSSASVCVNSLQAMAAHLGLPLSREDLAEKAFYIANTVLGKSVGKQDEYAAVFGGLNFITFNRDGSVEVEPLRLDPGLIHSLEQKLMLFFTGTAHHSWSILEEQEASTRSGAALESLHHIKKLAVQMRDALLTGDLDSFGELLHQGWMNKKSISTRISNPAIDRTYAIARKKGAKGGKITGAGGGGFLLLYCDEEHQPAVRQALTAEGAKELQFAFEFEGSQVLGSDESLVYSSLFRSSPSF